MTFNEHQTGGVALDAEFAEAVPAILDAATAKQADLLLQNIQCRAEELVSLEAKLARAGAAADARIGDLAEHGSGCR